MISIYCEKCDHYLGYADGVNEARVDPCAVCMGHAVREAFKNGTETAEKVLFEAVGRLVGREVPDGLCIR